MADCKLKPWRTCPPLLMALLWLALGTSGCQTRVSVKATLHEGDFREAAQQGALTISGHIHKYAARPVYLDPVTPYASAIFRALSGRGVFSTTNETDTVQLNPIMLKHRRTVTADTDGYFVFENVPPGRYYLDWYDSWREHNTDVVHREGEPYGIQITHEYNFSAPRGKWHYKQITVRDGQDVSEVDF